MNEEEKKIFIQQWKQRMKNIKKISIEEERKKPLLKNRDTIWTSDDPRIVKMREDLRRKK